MSSWRLPRYVFFHLLFSIYNLRKSSSKFSWTKLFSFINRYIQMKNLRAQSDRIFTRLWWLSFVGFGLRKLKTYNFLSYISKLLMVCLQFANPGVLVLIHGQHRHSLANIYWIERLNKGRVTGLRTSFSVCYSKFMKLNVVK